MERVRELIDKLWKQHQQQEGPEQLLNTVQHLQEALSRMVRQEQTASAGKVAVVLPPKRRVTTVSVAPAAQVPASESPEPAPATPLQVAGEPLVPAGGPDTPVAEPQAAVAPIPEADLPYLPRAAALPQPEPEPVPVQAPQGEAAQLKTPYSLQKPVVAEPTTPPAQAVQIQQPEISPAPPKQAEPEREVYHLHFDTTDEAPTLTQQYAQQPRELHQLIGEQKESLNDRLKQDQPELGNKLKDTPIKDLRKAIGVNDKFLFIRELFRGDEAMYERSIKTINNFHILPEAEYWISRELKVKLGWDDRSDAAQVFNQLVRRRFL